jgi:hypothetical protein
MAFTDHSDLFASVHEDGINLAVRHLMRQRPSWFNYATAYFVDHKEKLCVQIDVAKAVTDANNPLFDVQDPIPVFGTPTPMGLNWCFHFTDAQIDFHPGNVITLPAEQGTLPAQRLAIRLKACFGLDCPSNELIERLLPGIEEQAAAQRGKDSRGDDQTQVVALEPSEIVCFCLELSIVAHAEWGTIGTSTKQWFKVRLDGIEIVDLQPTPMENLIECYATTVLRLGVLPRLNMPIEKLVLNLTELLEEEGIEIEEKITLQPAPVPAAVPNNPAVEEDLVKVFIEE